MSLAHLQMARDIMLAARKLSKSYSGKPLLSEGRINVGAKLAQAKSGEFFRLQDGEVTELRASLAVMKTEQMTEDDILGVAERSAGR